MSARSDAMNESTQNATHATGAAGHELLIERSFDAPCSLVVEVWSRPEHIAQWWGPKDVTVPMCQMDFVNLTERGGRTHLSFHQAPFQSIGEHDGHGVGWNQAFDRLDALLLRLH